MVEGVERKNQLELLREMGCAYVQGHYYGAAMPFNETQLRLETEAVSRTITKAWQGVA